MSTDIKMIVGAQQAVHPRDVLYGLHMPEAGNLVVLDNGSLRRQVEWFACKRHLNWEEWQDIRDSWCRHNRALLCVCPRGSAETVRRVAEQGMRQGYTYLLLETIP